MNRYISSKDLLIGLTKTVLGKIIFKDIYGINGYFNDRLRKTTTENYINDETKERLIQVYNIYLGDNSTVKTSPDISANNLIKFLLENGFSSAIESFTCYADEYANQMNRSILIQILQIILSAIVDQSEMDIEATNTIFTGKLPQIIESTKRSSLSGDSSDKLLGTIQNMCSSGIFEYKGPSYNPQFLNRVTRPSLKFIGRDTELEKIENSLTDFGYCILKGMGGIGKTDLAKQYAYLKKNTYETRLFISFSNTLKETILSIKCTDDPLFENETPDNHFQRIMNRLIEQGTKLLLIIDNISSLQQDEPFFQELVSYDFNIIFTTRNAWDGCIDIECLPSDFVKELFVSHCPKHKNSINNSKSDFENLFQYVSYHTLTIELIAKLLQNSSLTLSELDKLMRDDLNKSDATLLKVDKDGSTLSETMYAHINSLYSINFSEKLISEGTDMLLINLALLPDIGFPISDLIDLYKLNNTNTINYLSDLGWISIDDSQVIHMHPIIREIILTNNIENQSIFNLTVENIKYYAGTRDNIRDYQRDIYRCELIHSISMKLQIYDDNSAMLMILATTYLAEFDSLELSKNVFERLADIIDNKPLFSDKVTLACYCWGTRLYMKLINLEMAEEYYRKSYYLNDLLQKTDENENLENEIALLFADLMYASGDTFSALKAYDSILRTDKNPIIVTSQNIDAYKNFAELIQLDSVNYDLCNNIFLAIIEYAEKAHGNDSIYVSSIYAQYAFFRCKYDPKDTSISFKYAQNALTILQNKNFRDSTELAFAYVSMAKCHRTSGNYNEARDYLEKAIDIYDHYIVHETIVTALGELAEVYFQLELFDNSISTYTKGITLLDSLNEEKFQIYDQEICTFYFQRSICYEAIENYQAALKDIINAVKTRENIPDCTSLYFTDSTLFTELLKKAILSLNEIATHEMNESVTDIKNYCQNIIDILDVDFYSYLDIHADMIHDLCILATKVHVNNDKYKETIDTCSVFIDFFTSKNLIPACLSEIKLYRSSIAQVALSENQYLSDLLDFENSKSKTMYGDESTMGMAYCALASYYKLKDPTKYQQYLQLGYTMINK